MGNSLLLLETGHESSISENANFSRSSKLPVFMQEEVILPPTVQGFRFVAPCRCSSSISHRPNSSLPASSAAQDLY